MNKKKLNRLWNNAVSNVGGLDNTMENLKRIIKEFAKLCREDGTIKHSDGLKYAKETVNSTVDFVEW